MERAMAPISHMLVQGGMAIKDWFSDKLKLQAKCHSSFSTKIESHLPHLFMAFNISMLTKTERAMVIG